MLRAGRSFALTIALVLTGTAAAVRAQDAAPAGSLSQIPVPGGLWAALAVLGDRAAPDRSQFLLEFIRRTYDMPLMSKGDSREVARQALVAHLDAASRATEPAGARAPDSLPLPLPPAIWIDVVFGGRAAPATLVQSIAGSREASLLYYGLMSLDEETRAWVGGDRSLIADLATRHAAAFAVAAPGLRVSAGLVRVPGGKAAEPAWEALVGRSPGDAAGFTRALLAPGSGDLPFLLASIAHLTPPQIEFALNLQAPDPSDRVAAARRLREAFAAVAWRVEQRTFWRPPLDPALLIADLETDENGRPILPGTEAFWTAAFAGGDPGHVTDTAVPGLAAGEPVDVGWLCNEIFTADFTDRRSRYDLVLFASRALRHVTAANSLDALSTLRAARAFPALVGTLERSRVADLTTFAAAARRASLLSAIDDGARAARALRQYQGILSILTRAAQRGGLASASLPDAVLSLSRVELSRGGQYEGRLVRWLIDFVDAHERNVSTAPASASMVDAVVQTVGGPFDRAVLRLAAGFSAAPPRVLTWEGTRYRVDHAAAEAIRLARLLGDGYPPYLASARQLVEMADALVAPGVTREMLRRHAADLHMLGRATGWEASEGQRPSDGAPDGYRQVTDGFRRVSRAGGEREAARLAPMLRALADDLLGQGLVNVAFAAAMGQPERSPILATDAASRHDFAQTDGGRNPGPWQLPVAGTGKLPSTRWHVSGSLLGLDLELAEYSVMRLSSKPPPRRPTINEQDQRGLTTLLALAELASITDDDQELVVGAMRRGRDRVAAIRTAAGAEHVADEIRLAPARRTLLPWIAVHDPARLHAFLSPSELLWLGLETKPVGAKLHAWGAPAVRRLGCLCVRLLDRRPWETIAGRWNLGLLASAFPDLNLRLAELLTDLQMPASLLIPVLAAATVDFNENATSRDPDDRRGPVEFVQALSVQRVEEYLSLLTADGPLVPLDEDRSADAADVTIRTGASR